LKATAREMEGARMLGCASVGNDPDERDQSRERIAFDREGADKSVQLRRDCCRCD